MKKCIKCNVEKELTEFANKKISKDGKTGTCKICIKEYSKEYELKNKENLKKQRKEYVLNNKEKIKEYALKNKEIIKEYNKEYILNNKEKIKEYANLYNKKYYIDNREVLLESFKKYRLNNKKYFNEYCIKYNKERKLIDPLFKLRCNIRSLIRQSIRKQGYTKKSKTYEYLGCTFIEFKTHLELQFTKGMNWSNAGEWHLDHIYPVSLAKDESELIRLNHYTNFQPLWAIDNLKKGNKIIEKQLTLI